jgi:hypothetical protein
LSQPAPVAVRLLLADQGTFYEETVSLPAEALEGYERLIDCLREDPSVLKRVYVDLERLAAAWLVQDEG